MRLCSSELQVDHLGHWAEEIMSRTSARLKGSLRVVGEYGTTTGPRRKYAKVGFLVEPAKEFEVVVAVQDMA